MLFKNRRTLILLTAMLLLAFIIPMVGSAYAGNSILDDVKNYDKEKAKKDVDEIGWNAVDVARSVFLVAMVVFLVWGAVIWVQGGKNGDALAQAKYHLTVGVVCLVLVFYAPQIVGTLASIFKIKL